MNCPKDISFNKVNKVMLIKGFRIKLCIKSQVVNLDFKGNVFFIFVFSEPEIKFSLYYTDFI